MNDKVVIETAQSLLHNNIITLQEFNCLHYDGETIIDDSSFPVDICDNGDVYIHSRGAYPVVLHNYAN